MSTKVTIKEYVEEIPDPKYNYNDIILGSFYDTSREMMFYIVKFPEGITPEADTTYEITYINSDDEDSFHYRVYPAFNSRVLLNRIPNVQLVAEYYNDDWYKVKSTNVGESVARFSIEDFLHIYEMEASSNDIIILRKILSKEGS